MNYSMNGIKFRCSFIVEHGDSEVSNIETGRLIAVTVSTIGCEPQGAATSTWGNPATLRTVFDNSESILWAQAQFAAPEMN
jgi:hypothetical protein